MTYVLYAIAGLVIAFIAFIVWRLASVGRGARQRDAKIMEILFPLAQKLERSEPISSDEVSKLAAQPQVRPMLYGILKHLERLDLFPSQYLDPVSQGEAQLAYWMMHPNELEGAPEKIELVESMSRDLNQAGRKGKFFVYRYKMPEGHWAGNDWILGLSGPYVDNDVPYVGIAGAFSRCGDKFGEIKPGELVDWYVDMAERKGAPWIERQVNN